MVEVNHDKAEVHHCGAPVAMEKSNLSSQDEVQTAYRHILLLCIRAVSLIAYKVTQASVKTLSCCGIWYAELYPDGLSQVS